MASILGRYGQAREDGYFKKEQEADIQEMRKRLIDQGRFTEDFLGAEALKVLDADGDEVSPVLMEVLQASARLSVPDAARQRVWQLRRRAGLPPLPDHELARAIRQLKLGSIALMPPVPASMSLRTNPGWRHMRDGAAPLRYSSRYELSPEQHELARRQFMLGLRTVVYGSMAGVLLVAGAGTAAAFWYDVRGWGDVRGGVSRWGRSLRGPLQAAVAPWRDYFQARFGRRAAVVDDAAEAVRHAGAR